MTSARRLCSAAVAARGGAAVARNEAAGTWALAWCDPGVEAFRASPFFWALEGSVGRDAAFPLVGGGVADVFEFTGSIPGVRVGEARQELALPGDGDDGAPAGGRLTSEVDLQLMSKSRAWPLELRGAMRTECAVEGTRAATNGGALVVALRVESTAVADTAGQPLAAALAGAAFPSGDALSEPRVEMVVEHADELVRITRVPACASLAGGGGLLFVHVRR
eukprot:PRCOL_00005570-RA